MITAEELLANNIDGLKEVIDDDDLFLFYKGVICEFAKSLAETHVTEALKQVSEKAKTKENIAIFAEGIFVNQIVDKQSILTAYPLENIK